MNPQFYTAISYSDDIEYRAAIRQLFSMSDASLIDASLIDASLIDDIDQVSLDENNYDPDASQRMLDIIYAKTRNIPIFQRIYICTAGFMLSEDPEIGLAVLFSYDYLAVFHPVLCDFFKDSSNTDSTTYKTLYDKIGLII